MTEFVRVERQGCLQVITIDRPESLNALSHAMYAAMAEGLEEAAADPAIRAVVLTGSGDYFTAGNDLKDFLANQPKGKPPVMRFLENLRDAPKPVIVGVNGPAIGIGLTLLLHCDLCFASETATFRAPFPQLGIVPEAGSSLLIPRALGMAWANEILLAGRTLNAEEALSAGLVTRLYGKDELLAKTLETATEIAGLAPEATRKTKALIRSGRDAVVRQMEKESVDFFDQLQSAEFAESVAALKEKRRPNFD